MSAVRGFDVVEFHLALDDGRTSEGLSWKALARRLSGPFAHRTDIRPISPSTLSGMAERSELNGNIVMMAVRWLGRTGWLERAASEFVVDVPVSWPHVVFGRPGVRRQLRSLGFGGPRPTTPASWVASSRGRAFDRREGSRRPRPERRSA